METWEALKLYSPKETWMDTSVALLWDKSDELIGKEGVVYRIYLDETMIATTQNTDYTLTHLEPLKTYKVYISTEMLGNEYKSQSIKVKTKNTPQVFDIRAYGAIGDGVTLNTKAIQSAIDACSEGGRVYVPEGTFVTGALFLKSHMTLFVEEGGKLLGTDEITDYPVMTYRFEGLETECYASLINTQEVETTRLSQIVIAGKGIIDANGSRLRAKQLAENKGKPGRAICLRAVDGIYMQDITVRQSPAWCVHMIYSNHISLNHVQIHTKYDETGNRYKDIANGDGFDPDSCTYVNVFSCMIASQDDCIAIKSGRNEEGRAVGMPSEHIRITNCTFKSGFGVAVGSEMSGSVRHVLVQDCAFENVYSVASIKTPRGRGGVVEDITYENIIHRNISYEHSDCKWFRGALMIDMFYSHDTFDLKTAEPVNEGTSVIRNILFKNMDIETVSGNAIYLAGLPESPIEGVRLEHIKARGKYGMKAYHIKSLEIEEVSVEAEEGLSVSYDEVEGNLECIK